MTEEKRYKVIQEKDNCIGCWACANVAPDYWEMREDDDNKSHLKGSEKVDDKNVLELKTDLDINMEAAEVCPVNCIHIEVEGEKKI